MTTASTAFAVIKSRIEANKPTGISVLRWQNEDGDALPDVPAAFLYTEFLADPAALISFGGGRGNNRYRNPARITAYVFVPRGEGLTSALDLAEQVAALFRSYRDSDISCLDATVYPGGDGANLKPPGLSSEVDNYFWASVEVSLFFDLIG
jgi:hypothetical protein